MPLGTVRTIRPACGAPRPARRPPPASATPRSASDRSRRRRRTGAGGRRSRGGCRHHRERSVRPRCPVAARATSPTAGGHGDQGHQRAAPPGVRREHTAVCRSSRRRERRDSRTRSSHRAPQAVHWRVLVCPGDREQVFDQITACVATARTRAGILVGMETSTATATIVATSANTLNVPTRHATTTQTTRLRAAHRLCESWATARART